MTLRASLPILAACLLLAVSTSCGTATTPNPSPDPFSAVAGRSADVRREADELADQGQTFAEWQKARARG